jgi:hypothetical protein
MYKTSKKKQKNRNKLYRFIKIKRQFITDDLIDITNIFGNF